MSRSLGKIVLAFAMAWLVASGWADKCRADEHSSHHGGEAGGGMGMGGMEGEHGGSQRPFFPSLMNLPSLTPEQRAQIEQMARERSDDGARMMSKGVDLLSNPHDFAAMQEGSALIREGLDQFQSGVAATQALAAGTAPRSVAIQWFRQQMDLVGPEGETPYAILGLSPLHFFSMVLLILVGAVALWIYFLRMRRARALMLSLAAGSQPVSGGAAPLPTSPPPPSAPPPPTSAGPPVQAVPPNRVALSDGAVSGAALPGKPGRWSGKLRLLGAFDETPEVKTFRLGIADSGPLPFTYLPGQFLDLSVDIDGKREKRSYTISSSPTERDYVEITVKREPFGKVSGYLHERVKEGDNLEIAAPSGRFTFTGQEASSIVLIGGGVGITPLMSPIRYLTAHGWPGDIILLYSFRAPQDFIFREELEYLQRRHQNLRIIATATRRAGMPWIGLEGRLTKEIIAYCLPKIASYRIHLCGPPPMMEAIRGMLLDLGVPREQIKTEAFGTDQRKPAGLTVTATGISAIDAPSTAAHKANGAGARASATAAVGPTVTFTRSGKTAALPPGKTILEASEDVGVDIDYSCRSGTCGSCKVRLVSGNVTMEVEEGLDPGDKDLGMILACQATATADVAVEA